MSDHGLDSTGRRLDRRSFVKYAGTGGAAAILAGCKRPGYSGWPRDTPTDRSPPQPLAGTTVGIGCLAPGPDSTPPGRSMWHSAQLAAADINRNGVPGIGGRGILGAKLEPFPGDTEASPETGRSEFERLVERENCEATVGTFRTAVTRNCLDAMSETETPHLTTGALGPSLGRLVAEQYDRYKWQFRPGPLNATRLGEATLKLLAGRADALRWRSVAVLVEEGAPLDGLAEVLDDSIRDVVEEVPLLRRTARGRTDWTGLYDEVASGGVDLVLQFRRQLDTTPVEQWAAGERPFELGGLDIGLQAHDVWGRTDGACRYAFTMNTATPRTTNTPRTRGYMSRYDGAYDDYPIYAGPVTYDAVRAYATAMARYVREEGLARVPTGAEMVDALETYPFEHGVVMPTIEFTTEQATFGHEVRWDATDEPPAPDGMGVPVWQQWQANPADDYGVMESFAPERNRTAAYAFPDWIDYPDDHPANAERTAGRVRSAGTVTGRRGPR